MYSRAKNDLYKGPEIGKTLWGERAGVETRKIDGHQFVKVVKGNE